MIIDCIADLHGYYPKLEGGDLLIVAGDLTASDKAGQFVQFFIWLSEQSYEKKIVIAGNHDSVLEKIPPIPDSLPENISYLCDSGTEFEGLKIWGSPWTLRFDGINPQCMAFTVNTEKELAEKWVLIPGDTDILVTHGPAKYVLDAIPASWTPPQPDDEADRLYYGGRMTKPGRNAGSTSLSKAMGNLKLKLHVFGHIHESYGDFSNGQTKFVNASHVNEHYQPINKPIRINL